MGLTMRIVHWQRVQYVMYTTHNGSYYMECSLIGRCRWECVFVYVVAEVGGGYVGITDLLAFIDCSWPRGCPSGTDALVSILGSFTHLWVRLSET